MSRLKSILLITTGGTIASIDEGRGLTPSITGEELLKYIPEFENVCYVNCINLFNIDSTDINGEHWVDITNCIKTQYDLYDGFVITHGTDTLSYSSAVLSHMIINSYKPIILTGSQYPINVNGSDAKDNLVDALRCAASEKIHGVNVVFAHKVIDGRYAKKMHTKKIDAFDSINHPLVATVNSEKIILNSNSSHGDDEFVNDVKFCLEINTDIFVLKIVPGISSEILETIFKLYRGIIIECTGIGGVPAYIKKKLCKLIELHPEKKVYFCSQVIYDGTDLDVYEVGADLSHYHNVYTSNDDTLEECFAKLVCMV